MIWKQRLSSMLFNSHSLRIQVGHFDDTPCYSIAIAIEFKWVILMIQYSDYHCWVKKIQKMPSHSFSLQKIHDLHNSLKTIACLIKFF